MPNIATMLKQEITRLARKEAKSYTDTTRKLTAQYRRDIAQLKRDVGQLTKRVNYLERQTRARSSVEASALPAKGQRFSANGLKNHREKIGLSAADYAALVGVTGQTIFSWEQGKSRPRDQQLAALVAVRPLGKRDAARRLALLQG